MPFTTSHPALVLPLKKLFPRWFSLTGLISGAMAPDLLYFLLGTTAPRGFSHSWSGLFLFCIPAGIAFSFAFHALVKPTLLPNLPGRMAHFFSGLTSSDWHISNPRQWAILVLSVMIGTLSHFFWDSFTHDAGEITQRLPFLTRDITVFGRAVTVDYFLHHVSSLVGGLTVVWFVWKGGIIPEPVAGLPLPSKIEKLRFWVVSTGSAILTAFAMTWIHNYLAPLYFGASYNQSLAWVSFGLGGWAGFFWATCLQTALGAKGRAAVPVLASVESSEEVTR